MLCWRSVCPQLLCLRVWDERKRKSFSGVLSVITISFSSICSARGEALTHLPAPSPQTLHHDEPLKTSFSFSSPSSHFCVYTKSTDWSLSTWAGIFFRKRTLSSLMSNRRTNVSVTNQRPLKKKLCNYVHWFSSSPVLYSCNKEVIVKVRLRWVGSQTRSSMWSGWVTKHFVTLQMSSVSNRFNIHSKNHIYQNK